MRRTDQKDTWKLILGFAVFSAAIALFFWAVGGYDYSPEEDGYIERIYHPPTGERRW